MAATVSRMTKPRLLATAALLLTAAALTIAGCSTGTGTTNGAPQAPAGGAVTAGASGGGASGGSANGAASPAPSRTGTYRDQVMAWGRRFAACARAHGFPNFPDPIYPAGVGPNGPEEPGLFPDASFGVRLFLPPGRPDKLGVIRALEACSDLARQMPPTPDSTRPVTAAQLAVIRQFSKCMRQHGFPDFPDPRADGTFPIQGGPYDSLLPYHNGGSSGLTNAYLACDKDHMPVRDS